MMAVNITMALMFAGVGAIIMYGVMDEKVSRAQNEYMEGLSKILREDYQLRRELSKLREERRKEREEHYLTD